MFFLERRQYQQPAVINGLLPGIWDTHILDAPGRANHKWLKATEKKVENVLFNWRVEAADKWDSGISKGSGQIVSFEYDATGAFDRTEETK